MTKLTQLKKSICKFHNDERGLEALQTVMILAIAAVALLIVKSKWGAVKTFFNTNIGNVTNWDGAAAPSAGN